MLRRFKYLLLRWLLGDICLKSDCSSCMLSHEIEIGGYRGPGCMENDVFYQARKVWKLEE